MSCKTTANGRLGRRIAACAAAVASAMGLASHAKADPLRLRADALAETQGTSSPTGLVVLQGEDTMRPWVGAEALVWAGAGAASITGDVLVLSVRLHEPHGYAEARAGRFVLATGAVHPVQIDGAHVIARAPWGSTVETFGGLPVVPRFGARTYDWLAGGRLAQRIANAVTLGLSYVQRREDGEISNEEVGADLAAAPARWLDLAAFGAYDVTTPGSRRRARRPPCAGPTGGSSSSARSSRPAGCCPRRRSSPCSATCHRRRSGRRLDGDAAPRLDLLASGAAQDVAAGLGGNGWLRATLRLDDRGNSSLGLEVRRVDVPDAEWSGVRAIAALPLGKGFRYSSEIEIVVPDHPDGRGVAWPWGLSALSWRSRMGWEVAGAIEASSTPLHRYEADALLRLSYALDSTSPSPSGRGQPSASR